MYGVGYNGLLQNQRIFFKDLKQRNFIFNRKNLYFIVHTFICSKREIKGSGCNTGLGGEREFEEKKDNIMARILLGLTVLSIDVHLCIHSKIDMSM